MMMIMTDVIMYESTLLVTINGRKSLYHVCNGLRVNCLHVYERVMNLKR